MTVRRQLYELLEALPGGDPAGRIRATGEFLDGLPAGQAEAVERRMLALAKALDADVGGKGKSTLDEFFASVDAIERRLIN